MKVTINRFYQKIPIIYEFRDGVIQSDYYKDYLVDQLPPIMDDFLKMRSQNIRILDMATGNGFTAVIMGKCYEKHIEKIVAYDINPKSVNLARYNVGLNKCNESLYDFRVGSLYEPLYVDETFDIILSALPPVPITGEELLQIESSVRAHHWVASTAGPTGRDLLDGMIVDAYKYLNPQGFILTVQADFQNVTKNTVEVMNASHLNGFLVSDMKSKKLKETSLTMLRRKEIMDLGYRFTQDSDGDEQFFIAVYIGRKTK